MTTPLSVHTLTERQWEALGSGHCDAETIDLLIAGQHSKFLLTLGSILDSVDQTSVKTSLDLLEQARLRAPDRLADILLYPHVSMWGWVCLETAMGVVRDEPLELHLLHLNAIAAVAAYATGITDFEVTVPLRRGAVMLPTLGQAAFTNADGIGAAILRSSSRAGLIVESGGESVQVPRDPHRDAPGWQGIRRIDVESNGISWSVAIDDLDPYRHYYGGLAPAASRLSADEIDQWKTKIALAWSMLSKDHPQHARCIAAGLKALVPVDERKVGEANVSPYAFGGIALNAIYGPQWFAFRLINEFQQSKLNALHDLIPLHGASDDELLYYGPWYGEPLSLRELFEGVYKGVAATEFWDDIRIAEKDDHMRRRAEVEFACWLNRLPYACRVLSKSDDLTPLGRRLLENVVLSIRKLWPVLDIDLAVLEVTRLIERDLRVCWRLRNLRTDEEQAQRLADAWAAGIPSVLEAPIVNRVTTRCDVRGWLSRRHLRLLRLGGTATFDDVEPMVPDLAVPIIDADIMLVSGDVTAARKRYCERIFDDPDDRDAWAGVVSACLEDADLSALVGAMFERYPEVVQAVWSAVRRSKGVNVDPVTIVEWLSPMLLLGGSVLDQLGPKK